MRIVYKDKKLERFLVCINVLTAALVAGSFAILFGFEKPLLAPDILYIIQYVLLSVFLAEKAARFLNSAFKKEFARANWFEIPLLIGLAVAIFGASRLFTLWSPQTVRHFAVGIYLVIQVVIKTCRTVVNLAASGRNPTRILIISFVVLIMTGAGMLMLPKSAAGENISFIDALFTSTSATCVTGLIVKSTGGDFSLMGQIIILTLIQLGGLGIVVFGAVFALLLGQALSLRESVAMQDLLSAQTLGKIGAMIAFIFVATIAIESAGAVAMYGMWDSTEVSGPYQQWFCSIFHSISAFCNAGFSLFDSSFIDYERSWGIYTVICPLVILGGLGFGVLYNLFGILCDRVGRFVKLHFRKDHLQQSKPKTMQLQTKLVLSVSAALIVVGMIGLLTFEHYAGNGTARSGGVLGALFQSITARTAGFNTIDISELSAPGKTLLMLLMFIGGSPGSTAGGIKTITFVVLFLSVLAVLRKRREVEIFKRSIRLVVVGRAITVTCLFIVALFTAALALSITERGSSFNFGDIMFESASALGTVGLSTGMTASLTTAGKLIIITAMLIGRLGPLTLLAVLTFNLKPVRYNYPEEAIIVG